MTYGIVKRMPKFYGAVTVGERGQVAIPAEARRELDIPAAIKLLAFGDTETHTLILLKAEFVTELLTTMSSMLGTFEGVLKQAATTEPAESPDPTAEGGNL